MVDKEFVRKFIHPENRVPLTFRATNYLASEIEEIAIRMHVSQSEACRILMEFGIDNYYARQDSPGESAHRLLNLKIREQQLRYETIEKLFFLKDTERPEDFVLLCKSNNIEPEEVMNFTPHNGESKGEACKRFLRILFVDRPEGLPGKRVLQIAEREGLGENLTRDTAKAMGFAFKRKKIGDENLSYWIPPIE